MTHRTSKKSERKTIGRGSHKRDNGIKVILKEKHGRLYTYESVIWIQLAQHINRFPALANVVMELRASRKEGNVLTSRETINSTPWSTESRNKGADKTIT